MGSPEGSCVNPGRNASWIQQSVVGSCSTPVATAAAFKASGNVVVPGSGTTSWQ